MRILFDLIGAQTKGSRLRGIGRYTRALALEMQRQKGDDDLGFATSANFSDAAAALRAELTAAADTRFARYATPPSPHYAAPQADPARRLGEAVVRRAVALDAPDVYLASSLFEAWPDDFALSDFSRLPARIGAAIVYDFIPALFSDLYLRDAGARRFQDEQMKATASADLMLAISESTRADAIRLLGVSPDRVVNISGAADDAFRPVPHGPDDDERLRALGVRAPFVFCASGDDPRKNVEAALDALPLIDPLVRDKHQFVFLTPFDAQRKDAARAKAQKAGLRAEALVFLDRVEDRDLAFLYARCALFLFPSLYEGFGLPALEAMQCGAAVLVGDNSSLAEIVDKIDFRCDTRSSAKIAERLSTVLADDARLADARSWSLRRAQDFSWRSTAARAWEALREAERGTTRPARARALPASLLLAEGYEAEAADILRRAPRAKPSAETAADCILASCPQLYDGSRRRLLVDVTTIVANDDRTGIQRVVRNVVTALYRERSLGDVTPVAVRLDGARLISCETYVARETGVAQTVPDAEIEIARGDCLLMLDNSWGAFARFAGVFGEVRAGGGKIVSCIYDLIPQLYKGASVGRVPEIHLAWLKAALVESDGMIAISRTVAEELCGYIEAQRLPTRAGLRIGWFHCGSDVAPAGGEASAGMRAAFASQAPTFLLVGTLEPRKGHAIALAAFDRLWAQGIDARLVLIGRRGWHVDALIADIRAHREFGRRLMWFEKADDADLAYAYDHCAAVLAPSYAEGFGLPLAEAAWKDKPVICSDIPVFREIGGDGALYFRVNDPDAMAKVVSAFLAGEAKADPTRVVRPTWREAALRIVAVVMGEEWMRRAP
ncbi:MAG: glycosyltransferase family 4 protein [Hyphomicrobiales bacterium]|nr:glycosyltransferase family 4 protein [Hyphomicrobiales bacterium]